MSDIAPDKPDISRMQEMARLGAEWWNDSCGFDELREAVTKGATGATSNPVIIADTIQNNQDFWTKRIEQLATENPNCEKRSLTWKLIESIVLEASAILIPIFEETNQRKGLLNVQIDPTLHDQTEAMIEQARHLAQLGPNIAIKIPATAAGIKAAEELAAIGVRVNTTVSFTLPQAVAAAEAIERGIERAQAAGRSTENYRAYVTLMVGRLDDFLKTLDPDESIDPGYLNLAGIAVFRKSAQYFRKRSFSATLLAAAYRNEDHWSQIIGTEVAQTVPYTWWTQFDKSSAPVRITIDDPVPDTVLDGLHKAFPAFTAAYEQYGLTPDQFAEYGATVRTLEQFIEGYRGLVEYVGKCIPETTG